MSSNLTRYRFAVLLIVAAMVLMTNPVLHALGHNHILDHGDTTERAYDTQWEEQELCPYCSAISHVASTPPESITSFINRVNEDSPLLFGIIDPDLRFDLATRLRAPPFLA